MKDNDIIEKLAASNMIDGQDGKSGFLVNV